MGHNLSTLWHLNQIVLWTNFVLKNKTEKQFLKNVDSKLVFGLPSVIEHLNYDQWSGHDTLNDQKIHWKAIFTQVHVACKENFLVTCVMSRPRVVIKVLYDT